MCLTPGGCCKTPVNLNFCFYKCAEIHKLRVFKANGIIQKKFSRAPNVGMVSRGQSLIMGYQETLWQDRKPFDRPRSSFSYRIRYILRTLPPTENWRGIAVCGCPCCTFWDMTWTWSCHGTRRSILWAGLFNNPKRPKYLDEDQSKFNPIRLWGMKNFYLELIEVLKSLMKSLWKEIVGSTWRYKKWTNSVSMCSPFVVTIGNTYH